MNTQKNGEKILEILNKEYNYAESIRQRQSVDKIGEPIPWFTYPSIFFLDQLDLKEKTMFEWGCGNSSLYFANKVKHITSIEHNEEWYLKIKGQKKHNMDIKLCQLQDEYVNSINATDEKYDVISIDGEIYSRYNCAINALAHLNPSGLIILDNSDWLTNTSKLLRNNNLIQVDMAGVGPVNEYFWCTSFYFTRDYNFSPIIAKQPLFVPGGLCNIRD